MASHTPADSIPEHESPEGAEPADAGVIRRTCWVHGVVQGVGFRWWAFSQARDLGIEGSATNTSDGRVCVVAQGASAAVEELIRRLEEQPSQHRRPGSVSNVITQHTTVRPVSGFVMR